MFCLHHKVLDVFTLLSAVLPSLVKRIILNQRGDSKFRFNSSRVRSPAMKTLSTLVLSDAKFVEFVNEKTCRQIRRQCGSLLTEVNNF